MTNYRTLGLNVESFADGDYSERHFQRASVCPAMEHYVEQGCSIRAAARQVDIDTSGAVTATRAKKVYIDRKGGTNVPDKSAPVEPLPEPKWVDQCKMIFFTAITNELVRKKYRGKNGVLGIKKIINDHSRRSGIPVKTLNGWYQTEKLKVVEGGV